MSTSRAHDAKRRAEKPWRSWYNTKEWYRLRAAAFRRDSVKLPDGRIVPRCRETGVILTGKHPAPNSPVADHTERHNGDPVLFFNLANIKTVSKLWHDSVKQSWEKSGRKEIGADGWPVETVKPHGWVSWDELHQPTNIRPSKPPLTLLFGPPAAGKSTYVKAHAGERDIIVDSDIEATRLGIDRYTTNNSERVRILKARNAALRRLSIQAAPGAWFSGIGDKERIRRHWDQYLKPARILILATPAEVCIARIKASDRTHKDRQIEAVANWHREFAPRSNETVIRDWM